MQTAGLVELSGAYVALSNAHAVNLIRPMLDARAVYASTGVGEFSGPDAIAGMMRGFFHRFPDVHWQVERFDPIDAATVRFSFVITATDSHVGAPLRREGVEHLRFTAEGLIAAVEVDAR